MESSLSFNATQKFRNNLLVRNLKPYTESGSFAGKPGQSEFNLEDLSVIDPGNIEDIGNTAEKKLKTRNKYGPSDRPDFGDVININSNNQTQSNQGEYKYSSSDPSISTEQAQNKLFLLNWYGPEEGFSNFINIESVERLIQQRSTYYKFIGSRYSPYSILLSPDPQGNLGLLSQDSALAQIGANSLRTELQYRVSQEAYQQTLGRVNVLDALSDPFDALAIATGNRDIIEKDWKISVPDSLAGKGLDFISRISGVYSPYSWIPGDYFREEEKQSFINQAINTIFSNKETSKLPENKSRYDIFLANTGKGQSKTLFKSLSLNKFRPNYKSNFLSDLNLSAPTGEYYVGSRTQELNDIISPPNELPVDSEGNKVKIPTRGYSEMSKLYENPNGTNNFEFGLNNGAFYNKKNSIMGGLVWVSPKREQDAGTNVGIGDSRTSSRITFQNDIFDKSKSTNFDFREGSLLDNTQKLVDSAADLSGLARLQHVGNAISQISKVFHDGNREITKGSSVYKIESEFGDTGTEYCRVFSKDTPYMFNSDLVSSDGMTTENRKFTHSVLDKTYNLNIVPYRDDKVNKNEKSTNIKDGEVKKYMFSLENLAWRTSNRKGFTVQDLPVCERGPNGGRIMWFPPYDLKVSEQNAVNWKSNEFLGRPEPIYTYNNTTRNGSLSWKIVVDHPSILNAIVDKELSGLEDNQRINDIVDSFIAGCRKYDIYELAIRFPQFTYKDIYDIVINSQDTINVTEQYQDIPRYRTYEKEPVLETYTPIITEDDWDIGFYFHNDIPGPKNQTAVEADESYETSLSGYLGLKSTYLSKNPTEEGQTKINSFFSENVENTLERANQLAKKIGKVIKNGGRVEMTLRGSASSPNTSPYNQSLSKRRVDSVKDYLMSLKTEDGKSLSELSDKIKINVETFGEDIVVQTRSGLLVNCQTELQGDAKIYSTEAMACRRTKIHEFKEEGFLPRVPEDFVPETVTELEGTDKLVTSSQTVNTTYSSSLERKKEVAKIVVRKLLNECDYFDMMKENSPIIYDGIKEKFKYFHPAFHSITPEGLNSRLTFLQQCIRPGDTIPVIGDDGKPKESDALNTSFGAPPICVLRIGDFYHTKIAINQISINYEPLIFDMNPEGIGVQPMIADINLSFYFIGGQGLKEPVARLQNALSFNFFANTEVYDERAEVTEDRSVINDLTWQRIEENTEFGINNRGDENNDDAGDTIGVIEETTIVGNTISGTTSYNKIMNEIIEKSKTYIDTVVSSLETINKEQSKIALYYFMKSKKYEFGQIYNYFNQSEAETTKLFGKPIKFQQLTDKLIEDLLADAENESIPLMKGIVLKNFKNSDIKKYKKRIKSLISKHKDLFTANFNTSITSLDQSMKELIYVINRLNFVTSDSDGYRIKSGKVIIYDITPTEEVHETSNVDNTKEEMLADLLRVSDDFIEFHDRILNTEDSTQPSLIESQKNSQNTNYSGFLTGSFDTEPNTRFCTLFYPILMTDPESFIAELLGEGELLEDPEWVKYVNELIYGLPEIPVNLDQILGSEGSSQNISAVEGLISEYTKLKDSSEKIFKEFKESAQVKKFETYEPYSKDKKRMFTYVKQETAEQEKVSNFELTYSTVNAGSPTTFNYKVIFN